MEGGWRGRRNSVNGKGPDSFRTLTFRNAMGAMPAPISYYFHKLSLISGSLAQDGTAVTLGITIIKSRVRARVHGEKKARNEMKEKAQLVSSAISIIRSHTTFLTNEKFGFTRHVLCLSASLCMTSILT